MTAPAPEGPLRPRGHVGVLKGTAIGRRFRDTSGQTLVEFALVMLPLCLLVMGIIDFGWIFKNYIGVRQGVRDAARQVAIGNYGSDSSCSGIGGGGLNNPNTTNTNVLDVLCLVHHSDDLADDRISRVALVVPPSYAAGQPITICEQYRVQSLTGAFSYITSQVHGIVTRVTTVVETAPSGAAGLPSGTWGEQTLFGGSWSSQCPLQS